MLPLSASFSISTHALREEGDLNDYDRIHVPSTFLPTPSARRATTADALGQIGDLISTHALREEGDNCTPDLLPIAWNFYPRPPRGGRPASSSLIA